VAAIAVAAISARMLAQAAQGEGLQVFALDLFGDRDTREAAVQWLPLGEGASLQIDGAALLDALQVLARRGGVQGWIAGAGFEARPELLEAGAALLPLCGMAGAGVRRVRDPRVFFACLDELGIAHPPVRHEPNDAPGWLAKDGGGCGGWHIRRAPLQVAAPTARHYWQLEEPGTPMSATFLANGRDAVLLGINEQIVRPLGERPFVFHGVVGPLPTDSALRHEVAAIVCALAEAFSLRGLCSLDFLQDGERLSVLEINPRPPASLALYPDAGLVQAHLRACRRGELPAPAPLPVASVVRGSEIVFAPRSLRLDSAAIAEIAALPDTHDLPHTAGRFDSSDPLCSVSAQAADASSVKIALRRRVQALHRILERLA
jgi:uncharacterized protein